MRAVGRCMSSRTGAGARSAQVAHAVRGADLAQDSRRGGVRG